MEDFQSFVLKEKSPKTTITLDKKGMVCHMAGLHLEPINTTFRSKNVNLKLISIIQSQTKITTITEFQV